MKDSGAKLLITGSDRIDIALKAADAVGLLRDHILVFCDSDEKYSETHTQGLKLWTQIWASEEVVRCWSWKRLTTKKELEETTAIINYSSGQVSTFSIPKIRVRVY